MRSGGVYAIAPREIALKISARPRFCRQIRPFLPAEGKSRFAYGPVSRGTGRVVSLKRGFQARHPAESLRAAARLAIEPREGLDFGQIHPKPTEGFCGSKTRKPGAIAARAPREICSRLIRAGRFFSRARPASFTLLSPSSLGSTDRRSSSNPAAESWSPSPSPAGSALKQEAQRSRVRL